MKKVIVERKVEDEVWETVDGIQFKDHEKALEWENQLKCVSLIRLSDCLKSIKMNREKEEKNEYWKLALMAGLTSDYVLKIFTPKSEEDIKNFLMYLKFSNLYCSNYCKDLLGKLKVDEKYVIFEDYDNCQDMAIFSKESFDEFIEERKAIFDVLMQEE